MMYTIVEMITLDHVENFNFNFVFKIESNLNLSKTRFKYDMKINDILFEN